VDNKVDPMAYLKRIYVDSLVHHPATLRYMLELMGAERIALGSDYPFPLGEDRPGEIIESLQLDESARARLLHGTALEWLALPKTRFA
jgi:aminocarboxymuconate-semialdehyde decarboxylase